MLMSLCACSRDDETAEDTERIVAQDVVVVKGSDSDEDDDDEDETTSEAHSMSSETTVVTTLTTAATSSRQTATAAATTKGNAATTKKNNTSGGSNGNSGGGSNNNNTTGSSGNNNTGGNSAPKTTAATKATTTTTTTTTTVTTTTEYIAPEDVDKYIDFAVPGDGDGYTYDGVTLSIFSAGDYHLTGTLNEGQVCVNVTNEEKVKLRLNGVGITKTGAPCIQIDNADRVIVTVVDGSSNYLESYTTNAECDAALFSKDDLRIKGSGYLYVFCDNEHGIVCNNDLEIEECELVVDAEKIGINSHKSILVASGYITSNGDNCGIKSRDIIQIDGGFVTACGGKKTEIDRGGIISDTGNFTINGGTVIAVGMNQTVPVGQTSAVFSFPTVMKKENIVAVSINGASLATAYPNKKYSAVLISDPSLYVGGTCDVWLNDVLYDNFQLTENTTQVVLDGVM